MARCPIGSYRAIDGMVTPSPRHSPFDISWNSEILAAGQEVTSRVSPENESLGQSSAAAILLLFAAGSTISVDLNLSSEHSWLSEHGLVTDEPNAAADRE